MLRRATRVGLAGCALLVAVLAPVGGWGLASESAEVWPVRNTLHYRVTLAWWRLAGTPATGAEAAGAPLAGRITDEEGAPLAGAWVLLTTWNGMTASTRSGVDGGYVVPAAPSRRFTMVVGAMGYRAETREGMRGDSATVNVMLERAVREPDVAIALPQRVEIGPAERVESHTPLAARAVRRTLRIEGDGGGNDGFLAWSYQPAELPRLGGGPDVPVAPSEGVRLPLLLVIYPGPAEEWEAASIPLAAAGYAVLAAGPPYSFEPERDVVDLLRLLRLPADGQLPGVDTRRIAMLAGSYSGLHALRVLQEEHANPALKAAVLMGAPTDLFDMRRRLEDRSFVPPFGLDQALVALGFPDREPLRYWRYSGAYHVGRGMPATLLIHSRQDDVVPYQQSELLARTLGEEGVPHELHLLDGGSHYLLSAEREARQIYDLTVRFLRERLG